MFFVHVKFQLIYTLGDFYDACDKKNLIPPWPSEKEKKKQIT